MTVSAEPAHSATAVSDRSPRIHIIDPDAFVRYGRERPWCGTFGAIYSPLVEHPDDANCQRCERRLRAWEAKNPA